MLIIFYCVMVFLVFGFYFKKNLLSVEMQGADHDKNEIFKFLFKFNRNILQYKHASIFFVCYYFFYEF